MGRKQILTVSVILKGAGFADQPVNNVPVLDTMLAFASQPGDGIYTLLGIPYLQVLHIKPNIYRLSNQAAVYRIHIMIDPDCAARSNSDLKPLAAVKTPGR
jgi:hypothetical protein